MFVNRDIPAVKSEGTWSGPKRESLASLQEAYKYGLRALKELEIQSPDRELKTWGLPPSAPHSEVRHITYHLSTSHTTFP